MSAVERAGAVDRRLLLLSRSITGALPVENREAMAWNLRADFETVFGAGMLTSDPRRDAGSSSARAFVDKRSTLIIAHATILNSAAPGAPFRSRIWMTEHRSLWLSLISLPLRSRFSPWKSKPNPASNKNSILLRQNEKLILRSSSN